MDEEKITLKTTEWTQMVKKIAYMDSDGEEDRLYGKGPRAFSECLPQSTRGTPG